MFMEMNDTDLELLARYARHRAEEAFAELVRRHVGLVFSAALRQVRSPQLAEEVAQCVFADLARRAAELAPDTTLAAWLYQVTRRTAIDVVRRESRRQLREQIACELNAMNATAADWTQIEPLLDEAMEALEDADRTAILLRYFKNQSLREVGAALGVTDDAAQKRVRRAVERLREFFTRRGVTVGAGGLAVVISANAVQAAPAGLAAAIATTALTGTVATTSTLIATTQTIAMTTLQKTLITAVLAATVGASLYEARQAALAQDQVQTLRQQQASLAEQIRQLLSEQSQATNQLAALAAENAALKSGKNTTELLQLRGAVTRLQAAAVRPAEDPVQSAAQALAAKVNQLKQRLEQHPEQSIPELQMLKDRDWLRQASNIGDLNSDDDYDRALAELRSQAKQEFGYTLGAALDNYIAAHNGQLPNNLTDLKTYYIPPSSDDPPLDDAMLQRYQLLQTGNLSDAPQPNALVGEIAPANDQHDTLFTIGAYGFDYQGIGGWQGNGHTGFGTNITAVVKGLGRR